jgi:hypothetical protein
MTNRWVGRSRKSFTSADLTRLLTLLAFAACLSGEAHAAPARRAMYVQDAPHLTPADRARLDRLLDRQAITDVIPYNLAPWLDTIDHRSLAAAWIDDLHHHGARVIIPIAGHDRLRSFDILLAEHPHTWVDGMVSELEYWNRPDAERAAAFDELTSLVSDMRLQAVRWQHGPGGDLPVGVYLGSPTLPEAVELASSIDFAFLDYSVRTPVGAWSRGRDRFAWFAEAGVHAWPIFYATGEVDMRPTLAAAGPRAAEQQFESDLAGDPEYGALEVGGFVYFTFEAMPE